MQKQAHQEIEQGAQSTIRELRLFAGPLLAQCRTRNSLLSGFCILLSHILSALLVSFLCYKLWFYNSVCAFFCYPLAVIFVGTRFRALGNILHECSHSMFVSSRKWNIVFGEFIAALDFGSLEVYQKEHFSHHMHLGHINLDADFKDRFTFGFERGGNASLVRHFWFALSFRHLKVYLKPGVWSAQVPAGKKLLCLLLLCFLTIMACVVLGPLAFVLFYVVPYCTTYQILRYWSDAADHAGIIQNDCEFLRTRNHLLPLPLLGLLFFPRNDEYHLVHHLFPALPIRYYPVMHLHLLKCSLYRERSHEIHWKDFFLFGVKTDEHRGREIAFTLREGEFHGEKGKGTPPGRQA